MMGNKLKSAPEKPTVKTECHHYWIIESPDGPTSHGVCKFCGEERDFVNSITGLTWSESRAEMNDEWN